MVTRVHIATDHAGMELSRFLISELTKLGYQMIDHGPQSHDPDDDYPGFCIKAAQAVVSDRQHGLDAFGIVLGGSGNGEQMAANKVDSIRAALVWSIEIAQLARDHNDANVIAVGARQHTNEEVLALVKVFLETPFSAAARHVRRIEKISTFERTGEVQL